MPDTLPILDELRDDLGRAYRRAGKTRRWWIPAGGLAVAAAAAVLVVVLVGGGVAPSKATAATALRKAADVAGRQSVPVPAADQYFYVHSHQVNLSSRVNRDGSTTNDLVTADREIWTSVDRPGRLETTTLAVQRLDGPGEPRDPGGHMVSQLEAEHGYYFGSDKLSRAELLAYPTDPQAIYDRLLAGVGDAGNSPEGEVFTEIGDALREAPAPAALRAGLYRALALVPGVELVGKVKDPQGRDGLAVAFTERGIRYELIFDPETADMLAERETVVAPEKGLPKPGTVIGNSSYLERAVTDTTVRP